MDNETPRTESIEAFLRQYYRGTKTVVTGGLGFIGSNLARRLLDLGAEVLVVDCLEPNTGGNAANLLEQDDCLKIRRMDLRRCGESPEIFAGVQAIFNLAGRVSHIDSMTDPVSDLGSNVHTHVCLLESCRRLAPEVRIVFASTRQIYGRPINLPVNESHPLRPVDVNGINKLAGEAYHTLYYEVYGLKTVSLRLTNTYGPCMRIRDARQTFLGIWLRKVLDDDVFEVWGGMQQRDLTHVADVVDAFLLAGAIPAAEGQIFNIGGGEPITLIDLAEQLIAVGGKGRYELKEFPAERLRIDIGNYYADDSKFRTLTGWTQKTSLTAGLQNTLNYYQTRLADYV